MPLSYCLTFPSDYLIRYLFFFFPVNPSDMDFLVVWSTRTKIFFLLFLFQDSPMFFNPPV